MKPVSVLIVMGVSGSGKTTVGALLAGRLGWEFEDADAFHPPANVDKMHRGVALTDEDRGPWLDAMAAWIDETRAAGGHAVLACSALKRSYRDIVIGARKDVRLVYLEGGEAVIARRLAARQGHFFPAKLLRSQFKALEAPGAEEDPIVVSIAARPAEIVSRVLQQLDVKWEKQ
jgi:carbohydrate kinase (thermoresistant glucokinase family)